MCGRYTLRTKASDLAEVFRVLDAPDFSPRFNIAPTQMVLAVRQNGAREFVRLRWGLVPSWADDPAIGNRMINARSETVATKPSFRSAFKSRRCLIVADGFYELQKVGKAKQPFFIRMKDDRPFGFAGLWEHWERGEKPIDSCTIITTTPNDVTKAVHDRMPVIIAPDDYDRWLTGEPAELLRPYPPENMEAFPVSTLVNSPKNESADCVRPMK